jgi:F-type H+-transporting ATPase subunit a
LRPGKLQSTIEIAYESLGGMIEPIIGKRLMRHAYPFLLCLFFFILIQNWFGLIPGVGTIGMVETHEGVAHLNYFFAALQYRPKQYAGASNRIVRGVDLVCGQICGLGGFLKENFGNKADKKSTPAYVLYPLGVIFLLVGCIEMISIAIRPISLSLRLYGNMFGGESLIMSITGMINFLVPIPLYFLELLVGLVQAFVFMLLTAVYIGLACNHQENH